MLSYTCWSGEPAVLEGQVQGGNWVFTRVMGTEYERVVNLLRKVRCEEQLLSNKESAAVCLSRLHVYATRTRSALHQMAITN